ncbi:anti-sigma factor antagonist [Pseudonocardiaceae bacterium YIM PH 21723]|nr:anti-sigma factor antagonist [Pseudonocardiaceae bacterium YIM PH 21723]
MSHAQHTGDVLVSLNGEVDLATAAGFGRRLDSALAEADDRLLVDLSAVHFLNSSGLAELVRVHKAAADQGTRMVLVSPSAQVSRVLEITGLAAELLIDHG